MLYGRCPMCGSRHNIVKVVSWPLAKPNEEVRNTNRVFKLCGIDSDGDVCCSYDDYCFKTREEADEVAATWGKRQLERLDGERQSEADEHMYFCDYGPVDSDPYDC